MLFISVSSNLVLIAEGIATFRAELRRIGGIFRHPSALVTLVLRCAFRLLSAACRAELALVYCAA